MGEINTREKKYAEKGWRKVKGRVHTRNASNTKYVEGRGSRRRRRGRVNDTDEPNQRTRREKSGQPFA